jgi:hypothetical protein
MLCGFGYESRLHWEFRRVRREGLAIAASRLIRQRAILRTPSIRTDKSGSCEVRLLTHKGDWVSALWTLKSFYYYSRVSFALHIHDGGLLPAQAQALQRHFPMAHFHEQSETTTNVEAKLAARGLNQCVSYRRRNIHTFKLFDFYLLSRAEKVIALDADALFFRPATQLLQAGAITDGPNWYCSDYQYAYALPLDEMERLAGGHVIPRANSGIACVAPKSIDFDLIEYCLAQEKGLSETYKVVEQSLHAICSSRFGMALLPPEYMVSKTNGLCTNVVAKHYVASPRPALYREGMAKLIADGFLQNLRETQA